VAGLALASPLMGMLPKLPGTLLRSPCRLIYLTTFALALAAGAFVDWVVVAGSARRWLTVVVVAVVGLHVADLALHDRPFIFPMKMTVRPDPAQVAWMQGIVGNGRVAMDCEIGSPLNRVCDDVGFFDSIVLARPYRFLLDCSGID